MKRLVLLIALASSLPVLADISNDVKKYLGSAAALFEKLEYEKALAQLKRAKAKSQGPEDDLKIALYEGIVLAEMGDANAGSTFTTALGMDPSATLPLVVGPKVQKVFDKAKAQVQKVLDAQAEIEKQKADEKKKQDEANKPKPVDPGPAIVIAKPPPQSSGPSVRTLALIPAAVGVAALGAGTAFFLVANGAHSALQSGAPANLQEAQAKASSGKTMQTLGAVSVGVGAAAVAAAVVMFAVGGSSSGSGGGVMASAVVTPDGAAASLTIPLP